MSYQPQKNKENNLIIKKNKYYLLAMIIKELRSTTIKLYDI